MFHVRMKIKSLHIKKSDNKTEGCQMNNYAFSDEKFRVELLNGKVVSMSPHPSINHNRVILNIGRILDSFLKGNVCSVFVDGVDVYLTEKDRVIPDVMIICNNEIIKKNAIYGSPDLMVEVLSPSSSKYDRGYKKTLYEKCSVKEYWIVDIENRSIETYWLKNERYVLEDMYSILPDYVLEQMTDEEKAEVAKEFKTSLFPDLTILVEDVFEGVIDFH